MQETRGSSAWNRLLGKESRWETSVRAVAITTGLRRRTGLDRTQGFCHGLAFARSFKSLRVQLGTRLVKTIPLRSAWIAVSGAPAGKEEFKEFTRRVRRAVGANDKSASHATRLA